MSRQLYVNLPVKYLDKTVAFFTGLGFEFDPRFTDENATCMIVNEATNVMLLVEPFFKSFIKKELVDSTTSAEVILALSADSREGVDQLVDKALSTGGQPYNEPTDEGPMYSRSFQDLDGHLWEAVYMDMSVFSEQPA